MVVVELPDGRRMMLPTGTLIELQALGQEAAMARLEEILQGQVAMHQEEEAHEEEDAQEDEEA